MRIVVAVALLALAACGRSPGEDPASLHVAATTAMYEGAFDRASDLARRGLAASTGDAGHITAFHLLDAEILLMQRDVAGASPWIDAPIPAGSRFAGLEARRRYLAAYRQLLAGDTAEALAALDDARTAAETAGATDVVLDIDILAGQTLLRIGRVDEGDTRLERARLDAQAAGDRSREAGALVTLGMGRLVRERFDEALAFFEPVLGFTDMESDLRYATALSNAGVAHARLGNFDRALDLQRRAIALLGTRDVPIYLAQALGELGHTEFLRGRTAEALDLLGRARDVSARANRPADTALWLDSSATALIDLDRWDEAERLNEQSISLKDDTTGGSIAPNLVNRAYIAAGRGQHARALEEFTAVLDEATPAWIRWQAHAGMAQTMLGMGRVEPALDHFERALAVVETERSTLMRPEYRISFLSRMMHFHRAYVDALVSNDEPLRALEVANASRARGLTDRARLAPQVPARAAAFVSRARQADTVTLFYWLAPDRSFVWTVASDGVRLTELPPSAQIDDLVARHRTFIEQSLGDPRRSANPPGVALAAAVLTPVLSRLPQAGRVIIVPDGSLHGVNFETLPVGDDRHYWIEDATIAVAPALSLAGAPSRASRGQAPSLLIIGDPVEGNSALPQLQFAGAEIDGIRAAFASDRVTVHRGREASPAAFLEGTPDAFSIVHFAAHATTSPLSPMDSAIELSADDDGRHKLYARDIARHALRADLVTISACRSAGDRAYSGEGLVGLAWAFLRAGSTRVVAGLWDVDDQSTATLMTGTYAGLATGLTPAEALRAAKLRLIAAGGNFAKPYYWAPFQVFTAEP